MADKLSQGSNFDIGVIGMQGKGTETQKNCITDSKKQNKKTSNKITVEKKSKLIRL